MHLKREKRKSLDMIVKHNHRNISANMQGEYNGCINK